MTKSKAAKPSLQILVKFDGATLSKPCHLQVHELRVPEYMLYAKLLVMIEANMTVKRAAQRQINERTVEAIFVLWSLCRYTIVVSILTHCNGNDATYHGHHSNGKIGETQKRNSDSAS